MALDALTAVSRKKALREFYARAYARFAVTAGKADADGAVVELGAGPGLAGLFLPGVISADIMPAPGLDLVADAQALPFADNSLKAVFMLNALHHLPDPARALGEIARCLKPGGRALITDQYPGWPARLIYRHLHAEPYHPDAADWKAGAAHPMAGANGAVAHMIFVRDRQRFLREFPSLKLCAVTPHTPALYWLCGGLKPWNLVPGPLAGLVARADAALGEAFPRLASFADYELLKKPLL